MEEVTLGRTIHKLLKEYTATDILRAMRNAFDVDGATTVAVRLDWLANNLCSDESIVGEKIGPDVNSRFNKIYRETKVGK